MTGPVTKTINGTGTPSIALARATAPKINRVPGSSHHANNRGFEQQLLLSRRHYGIGGCSYAINVLFVSLGVGIVWTKSVWPQLRLARPELCRDTNVFHHKSAQVRIQLTMIAALTSRVFFCNNRQLAAVQFHDWAIGPLGCSAGTKANGLTCVKFVRIRSYLLNNSISLALKLCCSFCGTTGPVSHRNCVMLHEGIVHRARARTTCKR